MGDYYNYTAKFNEIIENTETIMDNQQEINTNLEQIVITNGVIAFALVLNIVIGIVKKVFAVR